MTPKEKAIALVNRYYLLFSEQLENSISYSEAKECALVAVSEIINANPHSNPMNTNSESCMSYWLDVKNEIIRNF